MTAVIEQDDTKSLASNTTERRGNVQLLVGTTISVETNLLITTTIHVETHDAATVSGWCSFGGQLQGCGGHSMTRTWMPGQIDMTTTNNGAIRMNDMDKVNDCLVLNVRVVIQKLETKVVENHHMSLRMPSFTTLLSLM